MERGAEYFRAASQPDHALCPDKPLLPAGVDAPSRHISDASWRVSYTFS